MNISGPVLGPLPHVPAVHMHYFKPLIFEIICGLILEIIKKKLPQFRDFQDVVYLSCAFNITTNYFKYQRQSSSQLLTIVFQGTPCILKNNSVPLLFNLKIYKFQFSNETMAKVSFHMKLLPQLVFI